MGTKKAPSTEAETPFAFLLSCASDEVKARLVEWASEDPERLLLMLKRAVNPVLHLDNKQEGRLRQMNRKTVGKKKGAGEIPIDPQE